MLGDIAGVRFRQPRDRPLGEGADACGRQRAVGVAVDVHVEMTERHVEPQTIRGIEMPCARLSP